MKKRVGIVLVLGAVTTLAALGLLGATGNSPKPVRVDTGLLLGVADANGVTAYKGIPFAAPPTGDLRWRPLQPAAHWSGVRKADHFGASCMQQEPGVNLPWTEEFMTQGPISEDCLFLNVWTAAKSAKERRPVMVWIYGGGFAEGSSSVAVYDGAALASKGVVLVSMNYRVGVLGFLVHPELTKESEHHSSGNYGLLDQIAALEWVHRNIAAFGGDPNRVTIFGQSAGALAVNLLMESPLAKGLFVRAIAESGPGLIPASALGSSDFSERERAGVKYAESKGAHSLAELRAIPAAEFYSGGSRSGPPPAAVVADGWVVPLANAGPRSETPLMVGFVADDLFVAGGFGPPPKPTLSAYQSDARKHYGDKAVAFLKLYPAASDSEVGAMRKTSGRDRTRISLDLWAANQLKLSKKIYTYYFDRAIPWPAHPEYGAFHSSEIPYVFDNLRMLDRPWQPVDQKISDAVSWYWVNFAATGDPNGKGLPNWPEYKDSSHTTMEFGATTGAMPVADAAKLKFFQTFLESSGH